MRHLFLLLTIAFGAPACSQETAPGAPALPPQPVAPAMFDHPREDASTPGNGCVFGADGGTRAEAMAARDEPAARADGSRGACSPTTAHRRLIG